MVTIKEVRGSLSSISATNLPRVAVFVGGTSGIGKATLEQLIAQKSQIKVYVIGRNEQKNAPFLEQLRRSNPKAEVVWLNCQVSLLTDVERLSQQLLAQEESLDLLWMSAGFLPFGGRQATKEGLDTALVLGYYSRIHFAQKLIPLLNASTNNPRVISCLGGSKESDKILLDDLSLQKPGNYSLMNYTSHTATMNTLAFARLARENTKVVFMHHMPGLVATELLSKSTAGGTGLVAKLAQAAISCIARPMLFLIAWTPEQAGERSLYLATSAKYGGKGVALDAASGQKAGLTVEGNEKGALFIVGDQLETTKQEKLLGQLKENNAEEKVWEHTQEILSPY